MADVSFYGAARRGAAGDPLRSPYASDARAYDALMGRWSRAAALKVVACTSGRLEESMIRGVHTMFYTSEPEALRAFIRDKIGFSHTDVGEGWLIFDLPEADMGCHPAEAEKNAPSGMPYISFYCDDLEKTVAELTARGVEFTDSIADVGYGRAIHFRMPGDFTVQLYQPHYTKGTAAR